MKDYSYMETTPQTEFEHVLCAFSNIMDTFLTSNVVILKQII